MSAREFQSAVSAPITAPEFVNAYRGMLVSRVFEDKISALYRGGKIVGGVYVGRGQEAFSYALGGQLDRSLGDVYAPLIRDQAGGVTSWVKVPPPKPGGGGGDE